MGAVNWAGIGAAVGVAIGAGASVYMATGDYKAAIGAVISSLVGLHLPTPAYIKDK